MVAGHLQKKSGHWYAVITYKEDGKPVSRWFSTGLKVYGNKRKAKEFLLKKRMEITEMFDSREAVREKEAYEHSEIPACCAAKEAPEPECITLAELFPKWLQYKSLHTNAETYILRIERTWKAFYEGTTIVNIPINQLDKLTLDVWAHSLIKEHSMNSKKYYRTTVIMRQALIYAADLGLIRESPFDSVKIDGKRLFQREKKKDSSTQVFSREEVRRLEEVAWEDFKTETVEIHRMAPLAVLFQFQTGVRVGELCALRYEDVDWLSGKIHVRRMIRFETKEVVDFTKGAYGDREVILTGKAEDIIRAAREKQKALGAEEDGYIFTIDGQPLSYEVIRQHYDKYCDRIGTVRKSSHKSRKTYVSSLLDAGVNVNTIRENVGHCDERTTFNCYCYDRSTEIEKKEQFENALA